MDNWINRIIAEAIRLARDDALDAAIQVCEEFAKTGHNAECCVRALRDLKDMLPRPPSSGELIMAEMPTTATQDLQAALKNIEMITDNSFIPKIDDVVKNIEKAIGKIARIRCEAIGVNDMRCEDCKFWDSSAELADAQPGTTGQCRVKAPVLDKRSGRGLWPFTADDEWCARYVKTTGEQHDEDCSQEERGNE